MTDKEINEAVAIKLGYKFRPKDGDVESYWQCPYRVIAEDPNFPNDTYTLSGRVATVKPYCTDISAAWEIVEHLKKTDYCCMQLNADDKGVGFWIGTKHRQLWFSDAVTAPMAICKAFLKL